MYSSRVKTKKFGIEFRENRHANIVFVFPKLEKIAQKLVFR